MSDDDNIEEVDNLDADSLLNKAREDALAIGKLRKDLELSLEEISKIRDNVEEVSTAATAAQGVVISSRDAASENATAAEKHKNTIYQLLDIAKTDIQKERDDAIALLETIKKHEANTKLIANTADEKDAKVDTYEEQLGELITKNEELQQQIEDLLPGATSANLASAFQTRKNSFRNPARFWTFIQLLTIVILVAAGIYIYSTTEIKTFGDLIFFILKRSPIIGAIVFLEEIARRKINIMFRLEEDYGYKEVLSRSFEGYKKQMEEIDASSSNAVSTLSTNLLAAMAEEPGRLIDKEKPVTKLPADVIEDIVNSLKDHMNKDK